MSCSTNSFLFATLRDLALTERPQQGSSTGDADQGTEQPPFTPEQLAWIDRLVVGRQTQRKPKSDGPATLYLTTHYQQRHPRKRSTLSSGGVVVNVIGT